MDTAGMNIFNTEIGKTIPAIYRNIVQYIAYSAE